MRRLVYFIGTATCLSQLYKSHCAFFIAIQFPALGMWKQGVRCKGFRNRALSHLEVHPIIERRAIRITRATHRNARSDRGKERKKPDWARTGDLVTRIYNTSDRTTKLRAKVYNVC